MGFAVRRIGNLSCFARTRERDGHRVAKRVGGGDGKWYFTDGLNVLAEGTGTGDKTFYTQTGSAPGGIVCRDENGTKLWYHVDRLGNVMAVTDANGNAYAVYTMDAFGNVLEKGTSTGYSSEHGTDPQPYHMTTKEYDGDADLYYFDSRWYDPVTGRFLSVDPEDDLGSPYPICRNNPLTFVDPTGRVIAPWEPGGGTLTLQEWWALLRALWGVCMKIIKRQGMTVPGKKGTELELILSLCGTRAPCEDAKCLLDCCTKTGINIYYHSNCRQKGHRGSPLIGSPCDMIICPYAIKKPFGDIFNWLEATIAHELLHHCGGSDGKKRNGSTYCFEMFFW